MVRGVRDLLEGSQVADLIRSPCACRPVLMAPSFGRLRSASRGRTITQVRRRAKRIVLHLDSGAGVVIEPRMTGLLLVRDPPDVEHLRLEWQLRRGQTARSVWFWDRRGLGTISLYSAEKLRVLLEGPQLGRDALEMSIDHWRESLARTSRSVKVALLDQKLVAGIGNLYASEILHRAGIHPATAADRISVKRIAKLHAATLHILSEAIRYEGSTLSDGTYRNALNQDGGYQNQHRVYDRAGEDCPTCGQTSITRIVQAQRSTFFCARCQRR